MSLSTTKNHLRDPTQTQAEAQQLTATTTVGDCPGFCDIGSKILTRSEQHHSPQMTAFF
jgi:hypothetical protein